MTLNQKIKILEEFSEKNDYPTADEVQCLSTQLKMTPKGIRHCLDKKKAMQANFNSGQARDPAPNPKIYQN